MIKDILNGKANMSIRAADILFALVIAMRSSALLFSMIAMRGLEPFNVLAIRFGFAFLIILVIFRKRFAALDGKTILHGFILGIAFFMCMAFEMLALTMITSSETAFLENLAMIFVPLIEAVLLRRAPHASALISAGVSLVGVRLLTIGSDAALSMSLGEILAILGAFSFAIVIIATDRFSKSDDSFMLGILEIGFIGVFSLIISFLFESPSLPSSASQWGAIAYLVIVASCIGFVLQPVAQSCTTSEHSGLISSLNPLVAAVLGAIFLGERLGLKGIIGAALILFAVVLQNLLEQRRKRARGGTDIKL